MMKRALADDGILQLEDALIPTGSNQIRGFHFME